jgi:hypothetical protein
VQPTAKRVALLKLQLHLKRQNNPQQFIKPQKKTHARDAVEPGRELCTVVRLGETQTSCDVPAK